MRISDWSSDVCSSDLLPDDAHPVAELLHLAEDVAREQHGAAVAGDLPDGPLELDLHQRVEPRGRLIEQVQLHVPGQRGDERDLLAVPLRVGASDLGGIELEPLEQLGPTALVEAATEPTEQIDDLTPCHGGPRTTCPRPLHRTPAE